MLKRNLVTMNLGWVSSLLLLACSASYVKDVGDIDGAAGQGGSSTTSQGGADSTPEEAGAGGVVPQAGQGGGPVTDQGGAGGDTVGPDSPCVGCITDELGPAETVQFPNKRSTVSANVLEVTSPRLLQQIDATLQIDKRTSAAWVVYEDVGDQYELRFDLPTKLEPGGSTYSSGQIEVMLEAGHRYAIGIYLDVGSCYGTDAPESRELSFAKVAGGSLNGGGDYHGISEIVPIYGQQFAMRLYTTTLDMEPFACPTELAALQALSGQPCAFEGQQCLDPGPACEHNYSVECADGVWEELTGLPAPCP